MDDKTITRETMRLYWRFTKPYWRGTVVMLISRPLYIGVMYVGNIYLAGLALDKLVRGGDLQIWRDFGGIIIALIVSAILSILLERISLKTLWTIQSQTERDLSRHVYDRLINESANFHANHFAGALVTQTNKFVSSYVRLHDNLYWQTYALLFYLIFTVVLLAPRLPQYTMVLLVIIVVYTYISTLMNRRSRRLSAEQATRESESTAQLADSISNATVVKSFAREQHEKKRYEQRLRAVFDISMEGRDYAVFKDTTLGIPLTGSTILAVVFSIYGAQRGWAPVSTLLLASTMTRDLLMRLREFNFSVQRNIARAFGDARDMTRILLSERDLTDKNNAKPFKVTKGEITFDDVTFRYADQTGDHLFKHLNMTIRPGEKVGLVGHSGSGKTTITKLLLRFMDIDSGAILIDGQNIADSRQTDVRDAIAYVPQEPMLFHRSLEENIAYGRLDASHESIVKAAKRSYADDFIRELEHGYETLVGERGVKLSGGQRQRVAIARAMLKDAPILVLDEATSALDSESERYIQDALWDLMQGRTAIVIAHRLSTIHRMDRIIVLKEGEIIEEGSHHALLAKKGVYADLWAHQSGGFLKE